jgi:ribosomal protein S18 acetylase RimI-like enzyme
MHNIRQATSEDVEQIAEIEKLCFPEAEAATLKSFKERFVVFPECFYVLEVGGKTVGHINGCINGSPELPDELYENANLHQPNGNFQTIFGLAIIPDFQHQGYASLLTAHFVEMSRKRELKGLVLTCKKHLVGFYSKCGFMLQGKSESTHGGAEWYVMLLMF